MPARQAVLAVLVLLCACAKHEIPAPNKNTNWLDQCALDSDCDDELTCICGLCTVACQSSAGCEGRGGDEGTGVCMSTQSEQHAEQCAAEPDMGSICVASCANGLDCETIGPDDGELVDGDAAGPSTDAVEPLPNDCIGAFGVCATVIATGQGQPMAIAVDDERVYWLTRWTDPSTEAGTGQLVSTPHAGGELAVHAGDLHYPTGLKLDATHAYWIHDTGGGYDRSTISRVALAEDAELEQVYNVQLRSIWAIGLAGDSVYWRGSRSAQEDDPTEALFRAPKDGSLITNPLFEPEPADMIVGDLSGLSEPQLHRLLRDHLTSLGLAPDAHASVGWNVALHDDELFWLWERPSEGMNMVVLSPSAVGVERAMADAEERSMLVQIEQAHLANSIAVDETHVYWTYQDERGGIVERTDRNTGATETLIQNSIVWDLRLALSDDQVFVAVGGTDPESQMSGMIVRFPKQASATPIEPVQ